MRNLTKALAVVSLLAPATGRPLSIGDIELHSALNQTLNAEIRLHVAPGENPADVSVRLAPPEKFDQAGIPWSYFLSRIKLEPVVQGDGTIIVKVTSKETLTEPFLDFLLEVSWPQGSQYREFTLLIDPPVAYDQPAIPVVESAGYRVEPIQEFDRPVKKARSAARRARSVDAASAITPDTATSGEYGPIQKSDTLWRIATQLGAERGVPAKQMMAALYQANPEAFSRNDMDALKAGVKLRIPETEAILKPSQKLAKARSEEKAVPKDAVAGAKALELVAPVESKIAEKAVVSGQPGQEPGEAGGRAAAGEAGKAAEGKDLELQARIDRLEQQLSMMQQMLALKDQQLATLQQAGKVPAEGQVAPPAVEQAGVPPVQPPAAEQVPPKPAEPAQPEVVQPPVTAEPKPAPVAKPAPAEPEEGLGAYYVTMGGLGAGILGVLGWLLWRRRKIEEQANTESMFASASEIRMPDSEAALSVPVMELGSASAYDVGTVGESSFISDFTPSDFDAFDTEQSEVDPLSEADVYLAYGRYQQAEELIRHALEAEPGRNDFKLKLLEIFYAGENKEGFAAYAQKLADEGKQGDRAFWNKVTDMAKEILPDLPLFGGKGVSAPQPQAAKAGVEEDFESTKAEPPTNVDVDDVDFGVADDFDEFKLSMPADDSTVLEELNAEFADLKREESKSDPHSLDFDLGVSADSLAKRKEEKVAPAEDIESIDFDLDSLSLGEAPVEKTEAREGETEIESFDFNFDIGEPETPAADAESEKTLGENLAQPSKPETYDFSSFDVSEPEIITPGKESEASLGDVGEFDFNFDFETPIVESKEDVVIDLSVADLTDMDEFETKIDLAKAYMDMGDVDAAKSIAEEVLSKGSKEQKVVAQALLDELK